MMVDHQHAVMVLRVFLGGLLLALAGCSTTGNSFSTSSLGLITPGQTTLAEASVLLNAEPVDVYHQGDGSVMARWAHRATFVPDAVYMNRELWLTFDRNGYFERVVKGVNVPQAGRTNQANPATQAQTTPVYTAPAFPSDSPIATPIQL